MARDIRDTAMTLPIHSNSQYKNTQLAWAATDTLEGYNKNLQSSRQRYLLETFGWIDSVIDYEYNSHGFRTPEFDDRENFISLGCSFTEGVGLPIEKTWHHQLETMLGLPGWNLGVSGAGLDTCYRLARYYISLLKPKFVVLLEPYYNRFELHCNDPLPWIINPANSGFWSDNHYVKSWVADSTNMEIAAEKNIYAIKYICQQLNIKLYHYEPDVFPNSVPKEQYDLARDLLHPGAKVNLEFAKNVYNDIKGNHE